MRVSNPRTMACLDLTVPFCMHTVSTTMNRRVQPTALPRSSKGLVPWEVRLMWGAFHPLKDKSLARDWAKDAKALSIKTGHVARKTDSGQWSMWPCMELCEKEDHVWNYVTMYGINVCNKNDSCDKEDRFRTMKYGSITDREHDMW